MDWGDPTSQPPVPIEKLFLRFCRPHEDYSVELTPDTPLEAFTTDELQGLLEQAKARRVLQSVRARAYGTQVPPNHPWSPERRPAGEA